MAGSFTVGALAVASPEANAVGAVRLTLLPKRLEVEMLRAGSYQDGFVPGALTRFVRFSVPYTAVRGFVRREGGIGLTLDPLAAAPFNRFQLAHFTDLPLEALASAHKRREAARAFSWLLPLPLAVLATVAMPLDLASGVVGRGAVGLLVLVVLAAVAKRLGAMLTLGGPVASHLMRTFERRLSQRVGLAPLASHETDPFEVPEPVAAASGLPAFARAGIATMTPSFSFPWARIGGALAAVAVCIGLFAGFRSLKSLPAEPAPEAQAGIVNAPVPEDEKLLASHGPACACERADSPLWSGGIPVLSVLPISKSREPGHALGDISPKVNKRGRGRYDFDLAIVNNAAFALNDVRVLLTFARRDEKGERRGVTDRGLFWEGELGSGRSVKWGVKAPGTEVRIDVAESRLLSEAAGASGPASREAFKKLLGARQPLVRLHAATMLAYLGDPEAIEAARGLGALSEADEMTRSRISRALAPIRVCDVKSTEGTLSACVHNSSKDVVRDLVLAEVAPSGGGRKRPIDEAILAGAGIRVAIPDFGEAPEELTIEH
ncbi:MAG: HEAT repeat domain-containing protein [Polyangiaceae bacterium]|nr:HEAT repeat domain-containing protein [Polyangiaceae bacterium]